MNHSAAVWMSSQCAEQRSATVFSEPFHLSCIDVRRHVPKVSSYICSSRRMKQTIIRTDCWRIVPLNWQPSDGLKMRACVLS